MSYFDELYARHEDPWGYTSRWYEQRKRALTLASLPEQRYGSVLEIGASIGVLAEALADRADRLLALDFSAAAVERAARRLAPLEHVRVEHHDITSGVPEGPFDLVVLSEVGYYLRPTALASVLHSIRESLAPSGELVTVHWRHPIEGLELDGDAVQAAVAELGLHRLARHEEEDLLLDVHARDPRSVARRTGLV
ncbi:class I SAM-dependent DNA methyltransferase [Rathayibacter iranicus]|uniref:Methyltransferase domain-containing protein n=2 Tax=Rathayibacter iranicus TaxID=59737 RepID=A0AAD1AF82_9MICO|nr:SAM-dependent methyltransferase [Rathayibacter iranicus]AZZ57138.1 methyltransferase domain-containing protein [Rathayibacter iranicus]MWV29769.1 methyltransferase domain-containing protein [Rathayibacter iranicus NCPPB 2253 = VKM Ac-1602]PPI41380.1 SAM-dependent methyltransferase [Rathayibacter iranicus]PPI57408.1 SAM-dependent methyltransferase [Rathayibacter iranicus]PPI68275.1 SAM-dependent methyltransferase [Rathayibacter iranicus]